MKRPPYFFVFDVESVGLHGDAFAVGYVVVSPDGTEHDAGCLHVPPGAARGADTDREWVKRNVQVQGPPTARTLAHLRDAFWDAWRRWADQGAWMAADVAWPVEARFLARCVDDANGRDWLGPYPLLDIASVRFARGLDALGTEERREDEQPAHNPLADARQSARLLLEALA